MFVLLRNVRVQKLTLRERPGRTFAIISGLNTINELTKDGDYEMRVDMEDFENETRYAYYRYRS